MVYTDWIEELNIKSKATIYSSMNFWYLNGESQKEYRPSLKRPTIAIKTPLIRYLYSFPPKNKPTINPYGDITLSSCDTNIEPMPNTYADAREINNKALEKLAHNIFTLKLKTGATDIYFRIPPIYINKDNMEQFIQYMNLISNELARYGITVIGKSSALTTDPHKMCIGANHPNPKAREEYSDLLIEELSENEPN